MTFEAEFTDIELAEMRKPIQESIAEDVGEEESKRITDSIMRSLEEVKKIENEELPRRSAREFLEDLKRRG